MHPIYGWARRGKPSISNAPGSRGKNISVVAAMRSDGVVAWHALGGPMDAELFLDFIERKVAPKIRPGDVIVLDNSSIHKRSLIVPAIEKHGGRVFFIPPYHPELNAIEEAFSFVKHKLRRRRARNVIDLVDAIEGAFCALDPAMACAFIKHAWACAAQPS